MAVARDLKTDSLKFIMIFLVVLGHMGSYNDYNIGLCRIIYSFHMPVFIFLSGYFTSINSTEGKQRSWIKQTLILYVIAQLVHVALEILLRYTDCHLKQIPFDYSFNLIDILFSPRLALWYLLCLVYWRVVAWKISGGLSDAMLLLISVVLAVLSGFIPIDHTFSFQRAFAFSPFFFLGVVFKRRNWMDKLEKMPIQYVIIALLFGLFLAKLLPTYMPRTHYENWHHPVIRVCQSVLGVYLCLLILRISRIGFVKKLSEYGAYTLWVYIGHTYLIVIAGDLFPYLNISLNLFSALAISMIYCLIFVALAKLYKTYSGKLATIL